MPSFDKLLISHALNILSCQLCDLNKVLNVFAFVCVQAFVMVECVNVCCYAVQHLCNETSARFSSNVSSIKLIYVSLSGYDVH